jgi:hypothetical protein
MGIKNQISAHDTGDSPAGSDGGDIGMKVKNDMRKPGCNSAKQVKNQITKRPEAIFDIVAKDVKKPNITQKMPESAVEKHEREQREKLLARGKIRGYLGD